VILREAKGLLFACATAGETPALPRRARKANYDVEITDYTKSGVGESIASKMRVRRVGRFIREKFFGRSFGISALRFAVELRVSPPTVNDMVREKRGVTLEMAARLANYFGTSEQFWLNLQDAFAVHQVKEKLHKELRAIKPFAAAAAR
jgi:antitoxin HigA-1